jgi:hypothetical protein
MMIPDNATVTASQASSATSLFKLPHVPSASALMDLLAAMLSSLATNDGDKKRITSSQNGALDVLLCQTNDTIRSLYYQFLTKLVDRSIFYQLSIDSSQMCRNLAK